MKSRPEQKLRAAFIYLKLSIEPFRKPVTAMGNFIP